jgi:nucleotide-binding universal stress UspA family protein
MTKRAVVPLDRSNTAEVALQAIPKLLDPEDEVVLISIAEPKARVQRGMRPGRIVHGAVMGPSGGGVVEARRPDFPVYAETGDQAIQSQLDELQDYLQAKASDLKKMGFPNVNIFVEISQDPAGTIADLARRVDPTFIVMVRTTHPGVGERVFGTVAQHLIREDIAPVVILPAK